MKPIKGTEDMRAYPDRDEPYWNNIKGFPHYGAIKYQGESVYKVAHRNVAQLESLGWTFVHKTIDYSYMRKPVVS